MPHEPKRRHSIARKGKRRAGISLTIKQAGTCTNCGGITPFHTACPSCGFYKGKQIIKGNQKTA